MVGFNSRSKTTDFLDTFSQHNPDSSTNSSAHSLPSALWPQLQSVRPDNTLTLWPGGPAGDWPQWRTRPGRSRSRRWCRRRTAGPCRWRGRGRSDPSLLQFHIQFLNMRKSESQVLLNFFHNWYIYSDNSRVLRPKFSTIKTFTYQEQKLTILIVLMTSFDCVKQIKSSRLYMHMYSYNPHSSPKSKIQMLILPH